MHEFDHDAGIDPGFDLRPETDTGTTPGRPVDVVALVAGLVCAVLFVAFAFGDLDSFSEISRVVWPTVLVGIGIALLIPSRRR